LGHISLQYRDRASAYRIARDFSIIGLRQPATCD
jgi:hypothetical protein